MQNCDYEGHLVIIEYFFDVVLGRPTSYYVNNPVWSKRILKVGHNRIILEKRKKPENS